MLNDKKGNSATAKLAGEAAPRVLETVEDFIEEFFTVYELRRPGEYRRNARHHIFEARSRYKVADFWNSIEGIRERARHTDSDQSLTPRISHQLDPSFTSPLLHKARNRGCVVRILRRAQSGKSG